MATTETVVAAPMRVVSVDVLRGLTIALMILVNDPGDWTHTYAQLDHAPWNGFTLTDFVFPNFLFLVGVSIILSMRGRLARSGGVLDAAAKRKAMLRIVRRAALIFALKMFLSAYPHFHLTHLRIFGVLTRIAVSYLVAALVCLYTQRVRTLVTIAAVLLVGYWVLMRFVPVPGFGMPGRDVPFMDQDRNLAAWLDRGFNAWTRAWLHTGSLYNKTRDPEGILSTLPAIATTLIGSAVGVWIGAANVAFRKRLGLLAGAGALSVCAGLLWGMEFPLNKNLWTSSYVLLTAGLSMMLLAACGWLFDEKKVQESRVGRVLTLPWLIFGSNAIVAYMMADLIVETLGAIHVAGQTTPSGRPMSVWGWIYPHVFARNGSTVNTSLAFAVAFVVVCWIPNLLLWRKKIFVRL